MIYSWCVCYVLGSLFDCILRLFYPVNPFFKVGYNITRPLLKQTQTPFAHAHKIIWIIVMLIPPMMYVERDYTEIKVWFLERLKIEHTSGLNIYINKWAVLGFPQFICEVTGESTESVEH